MLFLLLLCLAAPATARVRGIGPSISSSDAILWITVAVAVIWAIFYAVALIVNLRAYFSTRAQGRRLLYAFLIAPIISFAVGNILQIVDAVAIPSLFIPTLVDMFNTWGIAALYVAVVALLHNRAAAMVKAAAQAPNPRRGYVYAYALHGVCAACLFVLGTTAGAYEMSLTSQIQRLLMTPGPATPLFEVKFRQLEAGFGVVQNLRYAASGFALFSCVAVGGHAAWLRRGWRRVGIKDRITKVLLYGVTPLYGAMCLSSTILLVVTDRLSDGFIGVVTAETERGLKLANVLVVTGCANGAMLVLLRVYGREEWWGGETAAEQMKEFWVAQRGAEEGHPQRLPVAGHYVPS
ncbi:hypothetical protein MKEN_00001100 [Mycena kentingensis (nom. inval.)]|nr:hypothetical protein MKEN_00001100 [Mycena kentingensis (nom. inval.)]